MGSVFSSSSSAVSIALFAVSNASSAYSGFSILTGYFAKETAVQLSVYKVDCSKLFLPVDVKQTFVLELK